MGLVHKVTTAEFLRMPGAVFAPVMLTGEMSDYVRVNKADLRRVLKHYGITEVEYYRDGDGAMVFVHGVES